MVSQQRTTLLVLVDGWMDTWTDGWTKIVLVVISVWEEQNNIFLSRIRAPFHARHPIYKQCRRNHLAADSIKVKLFVSLPLIGPGQRCCCNLFSSVRESPAKDPALPGFLNDPNKDEDWVRFCGGLNQFLLFPLQRMANVSLQWAWTTTTLLCCGTGGRGRSSLPCGEYIRPFSIPKWPRGGVCACLPELWQTF